MANIYDILNRIEKNRVEIRRSGIYVRSEEEVNKEYKELLEEFYQFKDKVDAKTWANSMRNFGEIDTEWRKTNRVDRNMDAYSLVEAIKDDEKCLRLAFDEYSKAKLDGDIDKCNYYDGVMSYYVKDLQTHPWGQQNFDELHEIYKKIHSNPQNNIARNESSETEKSKDSINLENSKSNNFLSKLNQCKTPKEVVRYIDEIVDSFNTKENMPEIIGVTPSLFHKPDNTYINGGMYSGFINPKTKISYETLGYQYHIYDKDYLYEFAIGIRKLNLPDNTNLLQYVLPFLDYYFGYPKDNKDRRFDIFYDFAVNNAEEFYKAHNIPVEEEMGALDKMQLSGDFPLSALKGKNAAQCSERAAIAQNILKVCGYNACIMYGEAESRGNTEAHCWNSILDYKNNVLLMDFSNSVYSYKNGRIEGKKPYYFQISKEEFDRSIHGGPPMESTDFHYEDGKKIYEGRTRKYAVGRSIEKDNELSKDKPKNSPFSDERIVEGLLNFNPKELELNENQLENK